MNKNPCNKVILVACCAAVASTVLLTSAMAKERKYHRMNNSDIIVIKDKTEAPSPQEYRAVTDAEAKQLQAKAKATAMPPVDKTSGEKEKRQKYHEMGNTRIVWLRSVNPGKGYETEEQYLKSKKETEAKPKAQ